MTAYNLYLVNFLEDENHYIYAFIYISLLCTCRYKNEFLVLIFKYLKSSFQKQSPFLPQLEKKFRMEPS